MSRDNFRNKQTIKLHKCLLKVERYDLVITPHKQKVGYIRSESNQKTKQKIKNKIKQKNQNFPEHETQLWSLR